MESKPLEVNLEGSEMWNSSYLDLLIFMPESRNPPEIQIDPFFSAFGI